MERVDYRLIIEEPQADFLYGNLTFDFGEPTGTIGHELPVATGCFGAMNMAK